jgi:MoaA/NifB/PqqE/SkfB family radical SAM enzyme
MGMELFRKIIDDALSIGIKSVGLNFYNEPLADPLIFERIRYVKSKKLECNFFSNGTLLEDKINAVLDSGVDSITFSFDGVTQESYEKIRVGANFERTQSNIRRLIEERNQRGLRKPSVFVEFVVQKGNLNDMKEVKSFWKIADGINICEVDNRKEGGLSAIKRLVFKHLYPCVRIFSSMIVMSNGEVAQCCMDYDGSNVLGNLNIQTINEVFNSQKWKDLRAVHMNGQGDTVELCCNTRCPYLYVNGGYIWWM